jgi:hypothetical protein
MAGFSVGQTDCWDVGWQALGEAVSPADAGALFGEFYGFVRALLAVAPKSLAWRPASCRGLCNDEWLALSMIEAAQRSDMVGLLAAAAKLLAVDELGDALDPVAGLRAGASWALPLLYPAGRDLRVRSLPIAAAALSRRPLTAPTG